LAENSLNLQNLHQDAPLIESLDPRAISHNEEQYRKLMEELEKTANQQEMWLEHGRILNKLQRSGLWKQSKCNLWIDFTKTLKFGSTKTKVLKATTEIYDYAVNEKKYSVEELGTCKAHFEPLIGIKQNEKALDKCLEAIVATPVAKRSRTKILKIVEEFGEKKSRTSLDADSLDSPPLKKLKSEHSLAGDATDPAVLAAISVNGSPPSPLSYLKSSLLSLDQFSDKPDESMEEKRKSLERNMKKRGDLEDAFQRIEQLENVAKELIEENHKLKLEIVDLTSKNNKFATSLPKDNSNGTGSPPSVN